MAISDWEVKEAAVRRHVTALDEKLEERNSELKQKKASLHCRIAALQEELEKQNCEK
jgi:hypothetical protein